MEWLSYGRWKKIAFRVIEVFSIISLGIFFYAFIFILVVDFDAVKILTVFDSYLRLVITSWPAAFLIVGLLLLWKQEEAIAYFIKNRMTAVGIEGVKGSVITTEASQGEVQVKNVEDAQEEEPNKSDLLVEEGITKPVPNTTSEEVYERYKKRVQIEEIVQTILIAKFRDLYRPHVKLSYPDGKPLILDGLLTTYAGKMQAVEIKYIDKNNFTSLKYVLSRMRDRTMLLGIKHLFVIIVADDLTENDATNINKILTVRASRYFFSHLNGQLTEVTLPGTKKLLN